MIDHLRGFRELEASEEVRLSCSVVTSAELYAGPVEQEIAVRALLKAFTEIGVDHAIAEAAGLIRRETKIEIADAAIAATALARGLRLMTRNIRDFERVDGLQLVPPR